MMIAPGGDFARRLLIRLKQPFATFIESVAVAAMLQSNEQTLHGLDPINRRLQLHQFSLGQFSPTGRCPGATGKTKKQFSDFTQSEAGSPRTLYHSKPVERCGNVFAHSFSESKEVFRSVRNSE
jgi:hypothetical protein